MLVGLRRTISVEDLHSNRHDLYSVTSDFSSSVSSWDVPATSRRVLGLIRKERWVRSRSQ